MPKDKREFGNISKTSHIAVTTNFVVVETFCCRGVSTVVIIATLIFCRG